MQQQHQYQEQHNSHLSGGDLQQQQKQNHYQVQGEEEEEDQRRHSVNQDREGLNDLNDESLTINQNEPVSELYIWGNDYHGQLGVGSEKVIHNLPKVCSFNIVVSDVSCGEDHTVFVQGDGGYVYAMGSNSEGRLGTGNPEMRSCNVPTLVDGLCNIKKVSCGTSHTLALSADGQVYAWGQAFYGALGIDSSQQHGAMENIWEPTLIPQEAFAGEKVKDLEAGSRHSIFVTNQNKIFGCGDANQGQLGLGENNRDRVIEPTQLKGDFNNMIIRQVSCGKYHTLFLVDNENECGRRELWACGANNQGQIGNNSNQNQFSPVRVDPRVPEDKMSQNCRSHRFSKVSAWNASAAVTDEGIMYVWGQGIFGEFKRPRKVKLQNNIKVRNVHVGGAFLVIIDQDNKVVVWGSNSNGEIGVGDSKIRNHPTRLETIDDKFISKVAVGGSFAFAIGKTTTRTDNSIFDETENRSQLSNIQKQGDSKLMDAVDVKEHGPEDPHRNNRSINSLEEQLQQIALHSASKTKQDSDERSQKPQDRSVGNFSGNGQTRFEQAANSVNLQSSHPSPSQFGREDGTKVRNLEDQVSQLKKMVEDKENQIADLQKQVHQKHEDYQEKLHRFKEMQDQELSLSTKLRDENKNLRDENHSLHDSVAQLRQELRSSNNGNGTGQQQPAQQQRPSREEYTYQPSTSQQKLSQSANVSQQMPHKSEQSEKKPDYFPGMRDSSTLSGHKMTTTTAVGASQQRDLASQQPALASYQAHQTHYSYDCKAPSNGGVDDKEAPTASQQKLDELKNSRANELQNDDDRFRSTYLREQALSNFASIEQQQHQPSDPIARYRDQYKATDNGGEVGGYSRPESKVAEYKKVEAANPASGGGGKLENAYKRFATEKDVGYPETIKNFTDERSNDYKQGNHAIENKATIDGGLNAGNRSQGSSGKKISGFQRSYTAETGGFLRQDLNKQQPYNLESSHARKTSAITGAENQMGRGGAEEDRRFGTGYRDRINTGRIENLRTMGSELMRPASQDGGKYAGGSSGLTGAIEAMRNSSSGFYQPTGKYARHGNGTSQLPAAREDTSEGGRYEQSSKVVGGLPDPSEIQNRLRKASNKYVPEKSTPERRSVTPNVVSNSHEQTDFNRVSYKPANERTSTQKDLKESSTSNYNRYPGRFEDHAPPKNNDFSSSANNDQLFLKQRSNSGNGRDPLYQTQNNLQTVKFEHMMSGTEGFGGSRYGKESTTPQAATAKDTKFSPSKPPRIDFQRHDSSAGAQHQRQNLPHESHQSSFSQQQQQQQITTTKQYAFTPSANRSTSNMEMGSGLESRPPTYKLGDYNSRTSYDLSVGKKDDVKSLQTFDQGQNNQEGAPQSMRIAVDQVNQRPSQMGHQTQQTPSYSGFTQQQPSSTFQRATSYTVTNVDDHHRDSDLNDRQYQKSDYAVKSGAIGGGYSQQQPDGGYDVKPRSPFTSQSLNEQKPQQPASSYTRLDQASASQYSTKLSGLTSSYGGGQTQTALTPRQSDMRSMPTQQDDGGSSEDIRSKLARYKKEREDFEMIRQQFRKKNSEIAAQTNNGGQENNTPANQHAQTNSGSQKRGSDGNIFAVNSSVSSNVQAFTTATHQVTSGSPAFGNPEQNYSRDH